MTVLCEDDITPLCVGEDTNIWFEGEHGYDPHLATSICRACPVRMDCLTEAIRMHIPDGIFGGLTPSQRTRYRRGGR